MLDPALRWSLTPPAVAAQINHLSLRWITQTGIGTALETHLDLASGPGGNLQFQALTINLLFAKELIAVGFTLRQFRFVLRRQAIEFQALLVQVVAVGDLPIELGFTGLKAFGGKDEGFANGEKVGFGFKRIVAGLCLSQSGKRSKNKQEKKTHRQRLGIYRCRLR